MGDDGASGMGNIGLDGSGSSGVGEGRNHARS